MRLVTFEVPTPLGPVERLGALREGRIVDLNLAAALLFQKERRALPQRRADFLVPPDMLAFLDLGDDGLFEARRALDALMGEPAGPRGERVVWGEDELRLKAPLPRPRSIRDFFAFEEHAQAGAARRKEALPREWYDQPVYYKGNPRAVIGPGSEIPWPDYTRRLDFEFEIAAVLGREARDVDPQAGGRFIAGYCVMNDCSARDVQRNEMLGRMGPAKGKDFATVLGPFLLTVDEWGGGIPELVVRVNGQEWSRSGGAQPYWSFALMLSHASQGETLLAGDVLGSGTYHRGCGLDLDRWVRPGDMIEFDAGPLGVLRNRVGSPRGQKHLKYTRAGVYA